MKQTLIYICFCCLFVLAVSCTKNEFMPPPQGEKVAYEDSLYPTIRETLEKSQAHLFYQAWQRSHMDALLKEMSESKYRVTLLVPGDAAFEQAGYTSTKIQSMEPADLDSLLMFYTLKEQITPAELNKPDNYIAYSLLQKPGLKVYRYLSGTPGAYQNDPYYFRHHLQLRDGKTIVNGKEVGAGVSMPAKEGYLWMLDKWIPKPDKTMLEALSADGHFTMLLGILFYTDSLYSEINMEGWGEPSYTRNPDEASFHQKFSWSIINNWQPNAPNVYFSTPLLPTDEAFRNAGFNSLEDLVKWNESRGGPYFDYDYYDVLNNFATDTLLDYHLNWGNYLIRGLARDVRQGGNPVVPVFYSNVMYNSSLMSSYPIYTNLSGSGGEPTGSSSFMPLEFESSSGQIRVKIKGQSGPEATVTISDIPTLMGPVHGIDHLLIPPGFKMN